MIRYALTSLWHRPRSLLGPLVAVALGTAMVAAFATLFDVAADGDVPSTQVSTLVTMGAVVGGWGLIIAVFGITSTLALAVDQRHGELSLLRSLGATPGQVRRLAIAEAEAVGLLGILLGLPLGALAGRFLVGLLHDSGQLEPAVDARFGVIATAVGVGVGLVSTTVAALITARRAARGAVASQIADTDSDRLRLGGWRAGVAGVLLAGGLACGIVTATAMRGKGIDAMQTAGQASIWFALGLAVISPVLLRAATTSVGRPVAAMQNPVPELAVDSLRSHARASSRLLMPITVFVAVATSTITMQRTEDSARAAEGLARTADDQAVATLNYVVVGMIALFAAIVVVTTVAAAIADRRQELGQLRLVGAEPVQARRLLAIEGTLLLGIGAVAGGLASLVTVIPFASARIDGPPPTSAIAVFTAVVTAGAALVLTSTALAGRIALRTPATVAAGVLQGT